MARPKKDGVDYWSFDVDLFDNKKIKLIKGEFGIKGVYIALCLINTVYRTNGYYKVWDDDDCLLMSEDVGCGCTPALVKEVLNRCCERSLFDKGVLDVFGVITSPEIQRRYLRIVANSRDSISIIQEYWLLNVDDEDDVPPGTLNKITFFSKDRKENPIIRKENSVTRKEKYTKQSIVNKSKVNKSKAAAHAPVREACCAAVTEFEKIKSPTQTEQERITELVKSFGEDTVISAIRDAHRKGGRSLAYVERILEDAVQRQSERYRPTYDKDDIEALMQDEWFGDE